MCLYDAVHLYNYQTCWFNLDVLDKLCVHFTSHERKKQSMVSFGAQYILNGHEVDWKKSIN